MLGKVRSSKVVKMGRCSLPIQWPELTVVFRESMADVKVKSIVDCLFVDGSIRVHRSFGVSRAMSGNSISVFHIELPPVFGIVLLSHI